MGTRGRRFAALAMGVVLLLGACSSDGDEGSSGAADDSAPTAEADPTGVVRIGYDLMQQGIPIAIDPLTAKSDGSNNDPLWYLVYGRFMRPTENGGLEPDLAESVEIVDPDTIVIELRDDLTFSDGSPFDAQAVKASLEATLAARADNENGLLPDFFKLSAVEATSPTTVSLRFTDGSAASWYDQYIPTFASSIVKVDAADPYTPIGAGPYKVKSVEPGKSWEFERNPNYWNADEVTLGGIRLEHVAFSQPEAGLAALQAGQFDMTYTEAALLAGLSGSLKELARISEDVSANYHICKQDGPLADARVRRAINMAIDRDAINEAAYYGTAEPAYQSWPTGHRLNNPDVEGVLAYDPEEARRLIEEAGYGDGVQIDAYPIQAFGLEDVAVVMKEQLADIGVTLNIVPTTDYVAQYMGPGKPGIGLYPSSVPGPQKLAAWTGDSLANVCRYDDPELTALIEQLLKVSERSEEAVDLWHQVSEIVTEDALLGFLVFRADLSAYNSDRLGDITPFPRGNYLIPDPFTTYVKAGS